MALDIVRESAHHIFVEGVSWYWSSRQWWGSGWMDLRHTHTLSHTMIYMYKTKNTIYLQHETTRKIVTNTYTYNRYLVRTRWFVRRPTKEDQ